MTPEQFENLIRAYQRLFSSEDGRVVLEDLKRQTTYGRCSIPTSGPVDRDRLVADEGRRGLVLRIVSFVEWDLEKAKPEQALHEENL